jgi:hypothetical protein
MGKKRIVLRKRWLEKIESVSQEYRNRLLAEQARRIHYELTLRKIAAQPIRQDGLMYSSAVAWARRALGDHDGNH